MSHLGLTLNDAKTCLRRANQESFTFLGYTFGPMVYHLSGRRYLGAQPAKKSIQQIKERVQEILHPGNQATWPEVAARVSAACESTSST